jgi:hypothetical protein
MRWASAREPDTWASRYSSRNAALKLSRKAFSMAATTRGVGGMAAAGDVGRFERRRQAQDR